MYTHHEANVLATVSPKSSPQMVNPESDVDPGLIPPLDPTLLTLSDEEKAFLLEAISPDETVIRERVLKLQKE